MKAAVIALIIVSLLWPDLPPFDGDNHATWRALTYPIALAVVPIGWCVFGRRKRAKYPYELDLLLLLPLLIDVAAPTLYHTVGWWDKLIHVVSWSSLTAASILVLARCGLRPTTAAALAIGFGLVTAAGWELWEYVAWVRKSPDLMRTEFSDTLGDSLCDLAAIALGVGVMSVLRTRRERSNVQPITTSSADSRVTA